jgi:hypothetical protein
MPFDLLLADVDGRPILPRPLPHEVLARTPAAEVPAGDTEHLWSDGGNLDSLREQRWGLVVPTGPLGQRLLERVHPLRQAREEEQCGAARVYEVAPGLDGPASLAWKTDVFRKSAPRGQLPRYLLILGDFDQVSLELQQVLATDAFVGRLAFAEEAAYAAYVEKVLRWERKPSREHAGRALFFAARDGTTATEAGREVLIEPVLRQCREELELGELGAWELARVEGSGAALRERAHMVGPDVLFTLSHGAGVQGNGADSSLRRRALQGALCLGPQELLTAAEVAGRPFLPGGFWLCFACFGAGTPSRSAYYPWLQSLWEAGASTYRPEYLLASLPGEGEPPFVAALPQAVLANPEGPLAFIGHVDLAWSYSFQDSRGRGREERFTPVIAELLRGHRAGIAHHSLMSAAGEVLMHLAICQHEHASLAARGGKLPPDPVKLGSLWMTWQDLRAFVLLGDPAVRLPMPLRGQAPARL